VRNLILVSALVALTAQPGGIAMAQSPGGAATARNVEIIQGRFEAWREGTGSPFDLLTEGATWTIVGRSAAAGKYYGREEFMRAVIRPFNARMREGLRPEIRRIYADGSTVIVFFDAEAAANDGVMYSNTYAWFLEMRDGRIAEATAFFDSIAFDELWNRVEAQ
jgi:hypothetical protein